MHAQKLSISLSEQQWSFMLDYQKKYHFKSRSEVIQEALNVLQKKQLEIYYQEANSEIDALF